MMPICSDDKKEANKEAKKEANDAHNRSVARQYSWLNDLFESLKISADEKLVILRKVSKKSLSQKEIV